VPQADADDTPPSTQAIFEKACVDAQLDDVQRKLIMAIIEPLSSLSDLFPRNGAPRSRYQILLDEDPFGP